ncbi:unknown [Clostridium sp. CAG:921]|nr:unknown [Clostridium sp. CAG:921]
MYLSIFFKLATPPDSIIPVSIISAASSGGVTSRVFFITLNISFKDIYIASLTSVVVTTIVSGKPVVKFLPFILTFSSVIASVADPICFFTSSASPKPIITLNFFFINSTISLSSLSPAIFIEFETTIPPSDKTAISLVPPPISTIIAPSAFSTLIPAPIADAITSSIKNTSLAPALYATPSAALSSTSVIPDGIETTTLGFENKLF